MKRSYETFINDTIDNSNKKSDSVRNLPFVTNNKYMDVTLVKSDTKNNKTQIEPSVSTLFESEKVCERIKKNIYVLKSLILDDYFSGSNNILLKQQ
jgi:hypothetical protein